MLFPPRCQRVTAWGSDVAKPDDSLPVMNRVIAIFRRSRRLSMLLVGALASLALAGSVVYALGGFTATIINTGNSAASGTIVLSETQGATTCLSTASDAISTNSNNCSTINLFGSATALEPGVANSVTVAFKNVGVNNASSFLATPGSCTAGDNSATAPYYGTDTANFCSEVDVTIENATTGKCVYPAGPGLCPALSSTDTLATLASAAPISFGSLAASATDSVVISAGLDNSATNADQGLAAAENLTWTLGQ